MFQIHRLFSCIASACLAPILIFSPCAAKQAVAPHPWTSVKTDTTSFTFAIVADRTGSATPGVFEKAIRAINLIHPSMVLEVGDLIEGYTGDTGLIRKEWNEIDSMIAPLNTPFYFVPGNHDLTTPEERTEWDHRFGERYYQFTYKGALFLCLNSDDSASGRFGRKQIDWATKVLADNPNPKWTFVFFHKPYWYEDSLFMSTLYPVLQKRKCTVFNGHNHQYREDTDASSGNRWISLGTTGAGSFHHGWEDGTIDHITLVTVADKQVHIANIAVDAIKGPDIVEGAMVDLADSLRKQVRVWIDPMHDKPGAPLLQTSSIHLVNASPLALRFSAEFTSGGTTAGYIDRTPVLVKPGDSLLLPIELTSFEKASGTLQEPALLSWRAKASRNARDSATIYGASGFQPDTIGTVGRGPKPIVVDGSLWEWDSRIVHAVTPAQILGARENWSGPKDCSFSFGTACDDSFVYVSVSVVDDSVMSTAGRLAWEQDGIEVRFDARADQARSNCTGEGELTDFLLFALSPAASPTDTSVKPYATESWPKGTKVVCVRKPGGYAAEIAVPVSYLAGMQGNAWQKFRMSIAVDDCDANQSGAQLWWKPDWREKGNYLGSGTFQKSIVKR